jgi:uncharacterized protein YcgL (UPF0745 family)
MSALDAQFEAQKIAFAPIVFQCARVLKEWGVLSLLDKTKEGMTKDELIKAVGKSRYALSVLLETAQSAYIVECEDERYKLTKVGYFLQNDPMTIANLDYNHHVNYLGMYHLDEALDGSYPAGLKYFGDWETIYPGLSQLPPKTKEAWFAFDHFYSDNAFDEALEVLATFKPRHVLDIGGNTGKFSLTCAQKLPHAKITIADLPQQTLLARDNIKAHGMSERIDTYDINILSDKPLPKGCDLIWMSQFLDCFGEDDVVGILTKVRASCSADTRVCILETVWDRQRFETSAFCIINTSPYFSALANGKSKMFRSCDLEALIKRSGFKVEQVFDTLGLGHSLFVCKIL